MSTTSKREQLDSLFQHLKDKNASDKMILQCQSLIDLLCGPNQSTIEASNPAVAYEAGFADDQVYISWRQLYITVTIDAVGLWTIYQHNKWTGWDSEEPIATVCDDNEELETIGISPLDYLLEILKTK